MGKKDTLEVGIDKGLEARMQRAVEKGEFKSVDDLIELACSEFLARHFSESDIKLLERQHG